MSRYFLLKCEDKDDVTIGHVLDLGSYTGTDVVEIIPEKRDSNWMERALSEAAAIEFATRGSSDAQ
jgi:hypothetical protein